MRSGEQAEVLVVESKHLGVVAARVDGRVRVVVSSALHGRPCEAAMIAAARACLINHAEAQAAP